MQIGETLPWVGFLLTTLFKIRLKTHPKKNDGSLTQRQESQNFLRMLLI